MLPVFSDARLRRGRYGNEYELTITGSRDQLFQTWVQQTADADISSYFRAIIDGIAQRNLDDCHLKICNGRYNTSTRSQTPQWSITILYGRPGAKDGPLMVSRCMSCDLECPLAIGVLGEQQPAAAAAAASADSVATAAVPQQSPVSRDSLLKETEHCRVWLDAKARPMFVITPQKHLEKLSDLSDAELIDFWRTAASVPQEMGCSSINTMVLNHGNNRNHAHLHLKLRIHDPEFNNATQGWTPEQKAQLRMLRSFRDNSLPPESRGTREAFDLRMRQRQQQQQPGQQRGQHRQRQHPGVQQRPYDQGRW